MAVFDNLLDAYHNHYAAIPSVILSTLTIRTALLPIAIYSHTQLNKWHRFRPLLDAAILTHRITPYSNRILRIVGTKGGPIYARHTHLNNIKECEKILRRRYGLVSKHVLVWGPILINVPVFILCSLSVRSWPDSQTSSPFRNNEKDGFVDDWNTWDVKNDHAPLLMSLVLGASNLVHVSVKPCFVIYSRDVVGAC